MSVALADRLPSALSIAGSDSGAGAGIQADLKTFSALGVYGCTVLTVITAQNTQGVSAVHALPPALVTQQLDAVLSDFDIRAAKTGALGNSEIINAVADALSGADFPLIVDPVMISKHGFPLIDADAVSTLQVRLAPLARLITPNLHEAAALTGLPIATDRASMLASAEALGRAGWRACVVKGGHLGINSGGGRWPPDGDGPSPPQTSVDLLCDDGVAEWLEGKRIDTPHLHGTGCTFSAAIVAGLVKGQALADAVREAKTYITGAIRCGEVHGRGVNPVNHFWKN